MLYRLNFSFAVIFLLSTISSLADVLHLQGGGTVEGTFVGGDSRTVRFLRQDGQLESFAITDVDNRKMTAKEKLKRYSIPALLA